MVDGDAQISESPAHAPRAGYRAHATALRERWRRLPWPVRLLLGIIGFLFAIWLILFITKGRFLKSPFEQILGTRLEREVRVGGDFQLYFAPISIKFRAEKARIANLPWASQPDLFRADLIDARIAPLSLIFGDKVRLPWLELRNGAVDLEWSRDHKHNTWTLGDPKADGKPMVFPLITQARLAGTTLRYRDPRLQLNADIGFETVRAKDTRFISDIRLSGTGSMRSKPFTLKGSLLSPNATVSRGKNSLQLRAQAGATVVDVTGTLPGATQLEGSDLRLVTRGPNLTLLFDFLGAAIPDTRAYRFIGPDQGRRRMALYEIAGTLWRQRSGGPLHRVASRWPPVAQSRPGDPNARHHRCRAFLWL